MSDAASMLAMELDHPGATLVARRRPRPEPGPGEVLVRAVIDQIAYFGDLSIVYLTAEDGRRLQCSRYNTNRIDKGDPPPGTPCTIGIHPEDLLLVGD